MKKFLLFLCLLFLFSPLLNRFDPDLTQRAGGSVQAAEAKKKALYFFSEDCAHCQRVKDFFKENNIYNDYEIKAIEASDYYNLDYLNSFFEAFKVPNEKRGWPVVVFADKMLLGDQPIINNFKAEIEKADASEFSDPQKITALESAVMIPEKTVPNDFSWGFLLSTAFFDSLNPCSLAVMVFLLAIFIFFRYEKKSDMPGFLFTGSVFISYFLLGFWNFGIEKPFQVSWSFSILMGLAAIFCGALSLLAILIRKKIFISIFPFLIELKMIRESHWISWLRYVDYRVVFILLGFGGSFLLFPCAGRPYIDLVSILSQKSALGFFLQQLLFYNLVFISPLLIFSSLLFFLARSGKTEFFLKRNFALINLIIGIVFVFIGAYFIHNRF